KGDQDMGPCDDECGKMAGHPINLTNGNVWVAQRDYVLPGLGGGIVLDRTWNSLWQTSYPVETVGMFGHSWRSTYEERLQVLTINSIKYWLSTGKAWTFAYQNDQWRLQSPASEVADLQFDTTTTLYTLTLHDGTKRVFNNAGYLLSITDRNGNQTSVTYDGSNRITQVTDAAGRILTFNYPNGTSKQVSSIQDSVGVIATYTYNTYNSSPRLASVTYADGAVIHYNYDIGHRLTSVTDTGGIVLEAHTYDGTRRGLTSERAGGAEKITLTYPSTGVTQLTDSKNNSTTYTYAPAGGRQHLLSISGPGCVTCGGRGENAFSFNDLGQRTSGTDAAGNVQSMTFDSDGNLASKSLSLDQNTAIT